MARVIWTDGVCINQADVDERSSQVGMMEDIYKEARELQIWLGEVEEIMPQAGTSDTEFATDEALIPFKRFLVLQGSLHSPPPLALAHSTTTASDVTGAFDVLQFLAEGLHFHEMPFFQVAANSKVSICPFWSTSFRSLSAMLCCAWWK